MERRRADFSDTAMVLNKTEYADFTDRYCKYHHIDLNEFQAEIKNIGLTDYDFISSISGNQDANKQTETFYILLVDHDSCEDMHLVPYRKGEDQLYDDDCYVVFADREMSLFKQAYSSYESLVQEFKDKMENYLPENFDWDSHIGCFSYARSF